MTIPKSHYRTEAIEIHHIQGADFTTKLGAYIKAGFVYNLITGNPKMFQVKYET